MKFLLWGVPKGWFLDTLGILHTDVENPWFPEIHIWRSQKQDGFPPDASPGFMVNAPCFTICHAWVKLGMLNPNVRKPCLMVKSLCDHHVLMVKSAYFLLVDLVDSCPKVLHLGGGWTLKVTVIYPSRQTENVGPNRWPLFSCGSWRWNPMFFLEKNYVQKNLQMLGRWKIRSVL